MKINPNEFTQEQIEKAMACKTAEELIKLAKREGYDLTRDEAEAYMAEMADVELDDDALSMVAGGNNCTYCPCQNDYEGRTGCNGLGRGGRK